MDDNEYDENVQKLIVVMAAQLWDCIYKTTELCTLNGWDELQHMNSISMNIL